MLHYKTNLVAAAGVQHKQQRQRRCTQAAQQQQQRQQRCRAVVPRCQAPAPLPPPPSAVSSATAAPVWSSSTAPAPTSTPLPADAATAELAYELMEGRLAHAAGGGPGAAAAAPPTAVLVHGLLGSRRNVAGFARMLLERFPTWQVLLVDLRGHGGSAAAAGAPPAQGPHSVESAARDVLALLRRLRAFPHMLIGHSFGGKAVMSMAQQFAEAATAGTGGEAALPRPVQVWVLDAPPGPLVDEQGSGTSSSSGSDSDGPSAAAAAAATPGGPAALIATLRRLRAPPASRRALAEHLAAAGFSGAVAAWMAASLRPAPAAAAANSHGDNSSGSGSGSSALAWGFDIEPAAEMFASYERADLWPLLRAPPRGLSIDFVRGLRAGGTAGLCGGAAAGIAALGHRVHTLDAGHWVHADNPEGLLDVLAPSFSAMDAHLRQSARGAARDSRR